MPYSPRKHKVPPIVWLVLTFLVLASGATRYAKTVDAALITVRLVLILALSVFGLRLYWKYRNGRGPSNDSGDRLLRRWRNWMLDRDE